eukprot:s5827_g2.t2
MTSGSREWPSEDKHAAFHDRKTAKDQRYDTEDLLAVIRAGGCRRWRLHRALCRCQKRLPSRRSFCGRCYGGGSRLFPWPTGLLQLQSTVEVTQAAPAAPELPDRVLETEPGPKPDF